MATNPLHVIWFMAIRRANQLSAIDFIYHSLLLLLPPPPPPPSSSSSSSSDSNPYAGLFDDSDPFPTVTVPKLGSSSSSLNSHSSSDKASWLSDQLDSLATTPRTPRAITRASPPDERKKHSIPRSVLFANSETARKTDEFKSRKPKTPSRKRFDRSPLTQQEANAFMSLLNSALAGTSSTVTTPSGEAEQTPFGSYTSLISNPNTQSGSKALLQAFAKRNRLQRFEEARQQRAKRFVREGLAAQIDPLQLEAGIDEAREQIAMCENLAELLEWTKREVWGIRTGADAEQLAGMLESSEGGAKYGKETAFYSSVLLLVFLAARDRYRSPHTALAIAKTTRSLGIESYVLGVTGSLYNEVLKTQWDWLGDLPGVVSTLRQARETGILSAPIKSAIAPPPAANAKYSSFVNSEDDAIRETVDRIANDVRKYVLDSQAAGERYKQTEEVDLLSAAEGSRREQKAANRDWSQNWLLANAEEATTLAGQPHRLMLEKKSRESRESKGGRGRFSGDRGDRKPFDNSRADSRSSSRYTSSSSLGSRSSSRSWA